METVVYGFQFTVYGLQFVVCGLLLLRVRDSRFKNVSCTFPIGATCR